VGADLLERRAEVGGFAARAQCGHERVERARGATQRRAFALELRKLSGGARVSARETARDGADAALSR
jgi:hypothetical protein